MIDTDVPIPVNKQIIPFETLEVGESYFAVGITKTTACNRQFKWRLDNRDHKKLKKFLIREFPEGTRIWRIK